MDGTAAKKGGQRESTNDHARMLSQHRDRLQVIEERLGIKAKTDNFGGKDHDQAGLVKGNPAKHGKEPGAKKDKLETMYARKRHA